MRAWLSDHATGVVLRGFEWLLGSRDLERARRRGARLGRLLWRIDPRWRPLAEAQAQQALGSNTDIRRLIHANYEHYGRLLAELASWQTIRSRLDELFVYERPEILDEIDGGALVVSAHLGNWEVMGMHYALTRGRRLYALVKPIHNRRVEAWINTIRSSYNVTTITTRDNALQVRKLLHEGNIVVTLLDQNSLYHEGVFVPFFGRPASTHYGPAMLALRAGVPVIPAFNYRDEDGRFRIALQPPVQIDRSLPLRESTWHLTAALTASIENAIRRAPEQWFWVHRRWKNQPRPDTEPWKLGTAAKTSPTPQPQNQPSQ